MISWLVLLSRFPVGSSASRMAGCPTRAREWRPAGAVHRKAGWADGAQTVAEAYPFERFAGNALAFCHAQCRGKPAAASRFSAADARDSRLKLWKTKPISRLRAFANCASFMSPTWVPLSRYSPRVARSRQPMIFIIVDLPEPEAPTMAMYSLRMMSTIHTIQCVEHLVTHLVGPVDILKLDDRRFPAQPESFFPSSLSLLSVESSVSCSTTSSPSLR